MSNGKNPLMLMMALTMPGAVHALGLGDIHVDSALNERLAAEIDLVGASAEDLSDLQAAVANRETFLRYGADRPSFLSSATFKVALDGQGRPVLAVRSTEAFSEPLVNFFVDLRWRHGELMRQYTLLLDPPGFASVPNAPRIPPEPMAAVPTPAAAVKTKTQTVARRADPPADQLDSNNPERALRKTTHIKVGARATLRGIAWRVGERSPADLQRLMIALFRANPGAFDGNINRLRLGAVLTVPSYAEVAAIPRADAKREFHAQMAAWHSPALAAHATHHSARVLPQVPSASPAPASLAPPPAALTAATAATAAPESTASAAAAARSSAGEDADKLNKRLQSLEQELADVHGILENQRGTLDAVRQQVATAEKAATVEQVVAANDAPVPAGLSARSSVSIVAGLALLAAALAGLYIRLRRRSPKSNVLRAETAQPAAPADSLELAPIAPGTAHVAAAEVFSEVPAARAPEARNEARQDSAISSSETEDDTVEAPAPVVEQTQPMLPVMASRAMPKRINKSAATISPPETQGGNTVKMSVDTTTRLLMDPSRVDPTRIDTERLDYNLVDLDMTAHHVQMPSALNEQPVMKERRTSLADALKMALEREPDRHDLRMKLLELYYSAATTNRQGFLDIVEKFALDRDYLHIEQWEKIAFMGRQIAAENPMFAPPSAVDDDLADCA